MALKSKTVYVCLSCGYESAKWYGKCPGCAEWNTLEEELREPVKKGSALNRAEPGVFVAPTRISQIDTGEEVRYPTGLSELDRVLGGGLVKGSLVLVSGDPGIGKSTILLQICQHQIGRAHV